MSADPHHAFAKWQLAWGHVAALPQPLSDLVHDVVVEMCRLLVAEIDGAAAGGEGIVPFDLLLFATGVERGLRLLVAEGRITISG